MKSLFTAFLFMIISQTLYPQWTEQNSGVTTDLLSVSAIDNNNVWVCGIGKVIKTTNGGLDWLDMSNGLPNISFHNIFAVNENLAIVISATSPSAVTHAYRTSDGGQNWNEVLYGPGLFMDAVWMKNQNEGIMIGDPLTWSSTLYTVKYTSNGGINWYNSFAPLLRNMVRLAILTLFI